MLTVHVRVNDSATGKPTPVRLRITDDAGTWYPPLGRQATFRTGPAEDVGGQVLLGGQAFAYIDGICEVRLPPGPLTVEIVKGPEYLPVEKQVVLGAGQIALRFTIERWTDERTAGWFAGDTRVHDLSPHAALLEGAGEGLAVVQLLAYERPPVGGAPAATPGLLAFSGTEAALRSPECLVAVNTLNTHSLLGSVSLLNSHRPVFPLRFGEPGELDHWSVSDWCDQCHRKKGLVVWPDLPRLTEEHPQGEALAALILGRIDAFEVGPDADSEGGALADYHRLLDCGLRPALAAGSGKNTNNQVVGAIRTYARLAAGEELSPGAWIEAVRAGRTFITNGPLLALEVVGHAPAVAAVRAEARSAGPLDRLEVLAQGTVLASQVASGDRRTVAVEAEFSPVEHTWIAARCRGASQPDQPPLFAHTSPVFLETQQPRRASRSALDSLLAVLDRTLAWVERQARCENEKQRTHLREVIGSARQELERRRG
jgi:hypothetical protein